MIVARKPQCLQVQQRPQGAMGKFTNFLKKSGALYRIINSEWTKEAADGLKSKEQFSQLVIQYERLVYTICFQLVRSAPAAEDLTQETFLAAYLHRDTMPEGYERQWLGRIAANKAKDYLQSAWNRHTVLPGDEALPPGACSTGGGRSAGPCRSGRNRRRHRTALRTLPAGVPHVSAGGAVRGGDGPGIGQTRQNRSYAAAPGKGLPAPAVGKE